MGATLGADLHALHAATQDEDITLRLGAVQEALRYVLRAPLERGEGLGNSELALRYVQARCGRDRLEGLCVLYLDCAHHLIHEEHIGGTIDETPVYVRTILKRGLEVGAAGILLAHNHPSGNLTPSVADRTVTMQLAQAARSLGMRLHDHLIVAGADHFSFRAEGLL